jgi:hypothetical protein
MRGYLLYPPKKILFTDVGKEDFFIQNKLFNFAQDNPKNAHKILTLLKLKK